MTLAVGGFFNIYGRRFDSQQGCTVGEPFKLTTFDGPGQLALIRPSRRFTWGHGRLEIDT